MTPIITFDQPLWLKAQTIIASEPSRSDLRSTVLTLKWVSLAVWDMAGTGLSDLLEALNWYASNAVGHILTGKAVARAVRAHFLLKQS